MTAATWSLTEHLLSTYQAEYKTATQHPFLLAAAKGCLGKDTLGKWLANDRLYIHSYIKAAGKLLATVDLPQAVPQGGEAPETQLVDWVIEALVSLRKEECFFLEVADRYGLGIQLGMQSNTAPGAGKIKVDDGAKVPGLVMMEGIFAAVGDNVSLAMVTDLPPADPIPWLEAAVTFWGTERCYLDAWSWAKSKQPLDRVGVDATDDADGGALRNEFIPNWSSLKFAQFVGRLGSLIDDAVADTLEKAGEGADAAKEAILGRTEGKWKSLLAAEATFWPDVE